MKGKLYCKNKNAINHVTIYLLHNLKNKKRKTFANQAVDVKLKLEQVVWRKRREELKPSLEVAKSNCRRLSSNWCPPITIDVLGFTPPSTKPRHITLLLTCTIEFAPKILQYTSLLCSTRSIWGTAGPTRVLPMPVESKHAPNGETDSTLGALANSLVKALMRAS